MNKHQWKQLLNYSRKDFTPINELVDLSLVNIAREILNKEADTVIGLTTGISELDQKIGGIQSKDFIVIGGRPCMGKTSLALHIVQHLSSDRKIPVVYFTVGQESEESIIRRLIALEVGAESKKIVDTHLGGNRFFSGNIMNMDKEPLMPATESVRKYNLIIDGTSDLSISKLYEKCEKYKREHGIQLIIVDNIQSLFTNSVYYCNRNLKPDDVSKALKNMTCILDVPMMVFQNLERDIEGRSHHRPLPSDVQQFPYIVNEADILIILYREEYYNWDAKEEDKYIMELHIRKSNRGCGMGLARWKWKYGENMETWRK